MPTPFAIFFVCWIALAIGSWIFYSKASYATKKAAHPFILTAAGIAFIGFAEWIFHWRLPWFFVVAVVVIIFLNFRLTRFCPQCNATLYGGGGFFRPNFCSKCGAKLQD
ncbi:MAG: hypothetical protein ABSD98_08445 [Candidatus Korobacteraceae bacterium]|jgi:hypothetical protein